MTYNFLLEIYITITVFENIMGGERFRNSMVFFKSFNDVSRKHPNFQMQNKLNIHVQPAIYLSEYHFFVSVEIVFFQKNPSRHVSIVKKINK